jgi:hypothetical protein
LLDVTKLGTDPPETETLEFDDGTVVVVVVVVVVGAGVTVMTPATYVIPYVAAEPPEHVVGYVPAGDEIVYVVVHVSPVRETPFTDGVPVIDGTGDPATMVCDEAVTVSGLFTVMTPATYVIP